MTTNHSISSFAELVLSIHPELTKQMERKQEIAALGMNQELYEKLSSVVRKLGGLVLVKRYQKGGLVLIIHCPTTDTAKTIPTTYEPDKRFLLKIHQVFAVHLNDPRFNVSKLAKEMTMSRSQLYRKLKVVTGKGINEYIRNHRLNKAWQLLQRGDLTVTEVAYEVGFSNPAYFSRCFSKAFGKCPSMVKRKLFNL